MAPLQVEAAKSLEGEIAVIRMKYMNTVRSIIYHASPVPRTCNDTHYVD